MKKGFFLAHAAVLLHQGVHAVPVLSSGSHPVEIHHDAPHAHKFEQPDVLKHIREPHHQIVVTEALHSQKGAIAAHALNPHAVKTHVLYTGGKVQQEAANSMHDYLVHSGVDPASITHSALKPHREGVQSQEKNFAGKHDQGLTLHDWENDGHKLLDRNHKVNVLVAANVPAETVVNTLGTAKKHGGGLGLVVHHDSGAAYRNNAKQEVEDKEAIGDAVHKHKGVLVWPHRDDSWNNPAKAMTRSSDDLKTFNPLHHVKAAEDASTFPHNKALSIDKIGKAVDKDQHFKAIREDRDTGKDEDYEKVFTPLRMSHDKMGEVAKDLQRIKEWVPKATNVLDRAHAESMKSEHFRNTVARPEIIAKHRAHINNHEEYVGSLEKPGMQLEYHDAHIQGALAEAAHNKKGNPKLGPYFVPIRHEIQPDQRVKGIHLDHVDPSKPTHWRMVNGDADGAFHNIKQMHLGKHEELHKELAAKYAEDGASTSS